MSQIETKMVEISEENIYLKARVKALKKHIESQDIAYDIEDLEARLRACVIYNVEIPDLIGDWLQKFMLVHELDV